MSRKILHIYTVPSSETNAINETLNALVGLFVEQATPTLIAMSDGIMETIDTLYCLRLVIFYCVKVFKSKIPVGLTCGKKRE